MRVTTYSTRLSDEGLCCLVKEKAVNYGEDVIKMDSPRKIRDLMNSVYELNKKDTEHLYMLCFNKKMRLIGVFEMSHGSVDGTIMNPREIIIKALLCNAVEVVLVHNHPSGDTMPSEQDLKATQRTKEALEIVGLHLADHIIISGNDFLSMRVGELL